MSGPIPDAAADFAAFAEPSPEEKAARAKEREKQEKKTAQLKPSQIQAAQKLSDSMKAEKEGLERSKLIQKIVDYAKIIETYYPEKMAHLKIPKLESLQKAPLATLHLFLADLKGELNRTGGFSIIKEAYKKGMEGLESAGPSLGLRWENLGAVAARSLEPVRMVEQESGRIHVKPGPAEPLLAELAVEYGDRFYTRIEVRFGIFIANMLIGVHRANMAMEKQGDNLRREVPKETEDLMKEL